HNEIVELASAGAQVVHPKAIGVIMDQNIDLWIRNTFNPEGAATRVVSDADVSQTQKRRAKAVTAVRAQSLIELEGRGMLGVQGIAARTFGAAARVSASVTLIAQTSSEQSILFAVPSIVADQVVLELEREFYREFEWNDIEAVNVQDNVVIVTVIGSGLFATSEFSGRLFTALGENMVDVLSITQGTSGGSISVVVSKSDADNSVRAIHELIVGVS
ncbi:MAG: aspartate kinase, partial [Chloroflexota bacterium]|nr:aspartate kinase [Chloroflexota bacterium]